MEITVDRVKCVGLRLREAAAPVHFEVGDDGKLVVLNDTAFESGRAQVEEDMRSCPTAAPRLTS